MSKKVTNLKATEKNAKQALWDIAMSNIQTIGNKKYTFVTLDMLFADERFQRINDRSKGKINQLVRGWNPNKLDALKGSLHPEELRISVIDGYHRLMAATILGLPGLVIEILQGTQGKCA